MLFYADKLRVLDPQLTVERVVSTLTRLAEDYRRPISPYSTALKTHAELVGEIISFGELHQGVADQLNPTQDEAQPELDRFGSAALLLGRCVYRSSRLLWGTARKSEPALPSLLERAAAGVAAIAPVAGGDTISARVPEGYAFYCLYPEMYIASVRKMLHSGDPHRAYWVLGIRSIGTSLAAIVGGALVEQGFAARIETVRPRGHPFDRFVELGPTLRARLAAGVAEDSGFVVVDEGPGLTCSSFLSVCSALSGLGAEERRLSILSAWRGAPSIYASEKCRQRWQLLQVFHTDAAEAFEGWRALVPLVRAAAVAPSAMDAPPAGGLSTEIEDLSYGRWRAHAYPSPDLWPVVHRPTERAKVLYSFAKGPLLAKFIGLGDYGLRKLERASLLADAGFSPAVDGLAYGFLVQPFLEDARPLAATQLEPSLLERMVDYYAFIAHRFSLAPAPRFESLAEMLLLNAREGLGVDAAAFVAAWRRWKEAIDGLPLASIDGSPQPHEWLKVGTVFLKTDSADHCHDHTLVGEQSILWDLAGACLEWQMDRATRDAFVTLWEQKTGRGDAGRFLEFYLVVYLAFRLAALHFAVHSTNEEEVRRSLQGELSKVGQALGRALAEATSQHVEIR